MAPWELDEAPAYWKERAFAAESGENWAENEQAAHQSARLYNQGTGKPN